MAALTRGVTLDKCICMKIPCLPTSHEPWCKPTAFLVVQHSNLLSPFLERQDPNRLVLSCLAVVFPLSTSCSLAAKVIETLAGRELSDGPTTP